MIPMLLQMRPEFWKPMRIRRGPEFQCLEGYDQNSNVGYKHKARITIFGKIRSE